MPFREIQPVSSRLKLPTAISGSCTTATVCWIAASEAQALKDRASFQSQLRQSIRADRGAIRGDPQSPLRWVSRSQRNIATALRQQGFAVSQKLVGLLLRELDYSCQANRKTREGTQHPDRNAQFEYINARVKAALAAGQPAISVDTKKKELVATSRTAVESCAARASLSRSASTTSKSRDWGRSRPMGSTTSPPTRVGVSVGIDADTAAFAVESIRRWWQRLGNPLSLQW